jgi:VIT1/CCC1 family predicted Fe2+/Mn2+ transporter
MAVVPDQRIVVVDLRIPFLRLMLFFIKASLAAIPAAIIVGFIIMILTAIVAGLAGGSMDLMMRRWTY